MPDPARGSGVEPIEPFRWDARWDAAQRDEAVRVASAALSTAQRRLDEAAKDIKRYGEWLGTAHAMKADHDAREARGDV